MPIPMDDEDKAVLKEYYEDQRKRRKSKAQRVSDLTGATKFEEANESAQVIGAP
jgi:hypothetical protein